jgi:hypothetical protein
MRKFVSILVASLVFLVSAYAMVAIYVYARGSVIDFDSFASSGAFWSCAAITLGGLSVGYAFCDDLMMRVARLVTVRLRLAYGISFALFVLAVICATFLPVAEYSLSVLALVTFFSTAAAFIGGYVRGWLIDHGTGGTRHMVSAA